MKKRNWWKWLLMLLVIIIGIGIYYQLFHQTKTVNNGLMKLAFRFQKHEHIVTAARFLPGDSFIVTSSVDSTIRVWNKTTGEIIREIKQPVGISYMDLSKDGRFVVTGNYDSRVRIWDIQTGKMVKEFSGHTGTIWTVAVNHDGSKIASAGDDNVIHIWDVASGTLIRKLQGHKRIVWSVKFSPDGNTLASGSFDFSVKLWNVSDGQLVWNNEGHTETVVDLAYSNSGSMLATTSDDKTIKLWDWKQKKLLRTMRRAEHVQAVAFSPDDRRIIAGGRDKIMIGEFLQTIFGTSKSNPGVSAYLWDVETGQLLHTITEHDNDVMDVAFSSDGKWVATASADRTVGVWQVN